MKSRQKKAVMIIGIALLSILLIALCVVLIFTNNIEKKAHSFLVEEVNMGTNGLYVLTPGKIKISFSKGSVKIEDSFLQCDTTKLNQLITLNKNPKFIYDIHLKEIIVNTSGILSIYKEKKLNINQLIIDEPVVKLIQFPVDATLHETIQHNNDSSRLLPSFIDGVKLDEITIKEGIFQYYIHNSGGEAICEVDGFFVDIKDININSFFKIAKIIPHVASLECTLEKLTYKLKNYILAAHHVDIDILNSALSVDSFEVIPKYKKYEFAHIVKSPTRAECNCSEICLINVDFKKLMIEHSLNIDTVTINNFTLKNYKNKNVPPTPITKPLFQEMVQQLPLKVDIPIVILKDGHVTHEELGEHRLEAGIINFDHIRGSIYGLTNIVSSENQYIEIKASFNLLNTGKINARMALPVDPKNEVFSLSGEVVNLDLRNANGFLEPRTSLSIESGISEKATFSITGNKKTSNIEMLLLYNDLELAFLKSGGEKKRWLLSELANDLILVANNPEKGKSERVVRTTAQRNPHFYQFNYIWLTLFEGIKESVGFTHKKQEQIYKLTHHKEIHKEKQAAKEILKEEKREKKEEKERRNKKEKREKK